MGLLIYILCMTTSLACSILLLRGYRKNGYRLLYWAGLCFAVTTLNNIVVLVSKFAFPNVEFLTFRLSTTFVALMLLLNGLIFEE